MKSSITFKHIVVTRFSVGMLDPLWYEGHIKIFESLTYASMCKQTHPDFHWIILLDSHTPRVFRKRLEELTEHIENFYLCDVDFFDHSRMSLTYYNWLVIKLREYLIEYDLIESLDQKIVFSNLDYDDVWSLGILRKVDKFLNRIVMESIEKSTRLDAIVIALQDGLNWILYDGLIHTTHNKCHSMGGFIYGSFANGLANLSLDHNFWPDLGSSFGYQFIPIRTQEPQWIYIRHARNLTRSTAQEFKNFYDQIGFATQGRLDPENQKLLYENFGVNFPLLEEVHDKQRILWQQTDRDDKDYYINQFTELSARKCYLNVFGQYIDSISVIGRTDLHTTIALAHERYEHEINEMLQISSKLDQSRVIEKSRKVNYLHYAPKEDYLTHVVYTSLSFNSISRTRELALLEHTKASLEEQTDKKFIWVLLVPDNFSEQEQQQIKEIRDSFLLSGAQLYLANVSALEIMEAYPNSLTWQEPFMRKALWLSGIMTNPACYTLFSSLCVGETLRANLFETLHQALIDQVFKNQAFLEKKYNYTFASDASLGLTMQAGESGSDAPVFVLCRNVANLSAITFPRSYWHHASRMFSFHYQTLPIDHLESCWQPATDVFELPDMSLLATYNLAIYILCNKLKKQQLSHAEHTKLVVWLKKRAEILTTL